MLKFLDYLTYFGQLLNGFRVNSEKSLFVKRENDVAPYLSSVNHPLKILDLANGRLRPQYALLRSAQLDVYGIDLVNRPQSTWTDHAYSIARLLYTWKAHLPWQYIDNSRLICGSVNQLPFPDDTFDLVSSVAAFEHFLSVPKVISEIHRVLRMKGILWVTIHSFASLSGGHNVKLSEVPLKKLPKGIDSWDHLRQQRVPFGVPLNKWRRDQYLEEFSKHFEILNFYCALREGEHLLTPAVRTELSCYEVEELTCGSYVIVARKTR